MIPKRIFYVWGYGERKSPLANICIENWRTFLPDYEIVELNEKSHQWFDFKTEYENNLWFKTVYDLKMWAYISDYMRIKTLLDHGGIYFDTDVTVYKKLDDLLFNGMFIGNTINNYPEMAIFGAQRCNCVLNKIYEFYQNSIWSSPLFIITNIIKKILEEKFLFEVANDRVLKTKEITIYPPDYFHPYHYDTEFSRDSITQNTYAVHWGNASWWIKKDIFFLTNKHRIPLPILLKKLVFLSKADPNANKKIDISSVLKRERGQ